MELKFFDAPINNIAIKNLPDMRYLESVYFIFTTNNKKSQKLL